MQGFFQHWGEIATADGEFLPTGSDCPTFFSHKFQAPLCAKLSMTGTKAL